MKRKAFALLACLLALAMLFACATPAEEPAASEETASSEQMVGMPSPIHEADTYADLLEAVPYAMLSDAPAGATDINYSYIDGEPVISQIQFTLDGYEYCYRAAQADEAAQSDISGIYYDLDQRITRTVPDGAAPGGDYTLQYAKGETMGLATWYYAPTGCQYSLWTLTGCDASMHIDTLVNALLPIGGNAVETTASGTVTSFSETSVFIQTSATNSFGFVIDRNTAFKGLRTTLAVGNQVTITYNGDIANSPLATSIETTAISDDPAPTPIPEEEPTNSTVTGVITDLSAKKLRIYTDNGYTYSFQRGDGTVVVGNYTLEYGCQARVYFDGYAKNSPLAKRIEVLAAPVPAPTAVPTATPYTPVQHTIKGTVTMHAGNALVVDAYDGSQYSFLLRAPRVEGAIYEGDIVTLTYQVEVDGSLNATYIKVVTPIVYDDADADGAISFDEYNAGDDMDADGSITFD